MHLGSFRSAHLNGNALFVVPGHAEIEGLRRDAHPVNGEPGLDGFIEDLRVDRPHAVNPAFRGKRLESVRERSVRVRQNLLGAFETVQRDHHLEQDARHGKPGSALDRMSRNQNIAITVRDCGIDLRDLTIKRGVRKRDRLPRGESFHAHLLRLSLMVVKLCQGQPNHRLFGCIQRHGQINRRRGEDAPRRNPRHGVAVGEGDDLRPQVLPERHRGKDIAIGVQELEGDFVGSRSPRTGGGNDLDLFLTGVFESELDLA